MELLNQYVSPLGLKSSSIASSNIYIDIFMHRALDFKVQKSLGLLHRLLEVL